MKKILYKSGNVKNQFEERNDKTSIDMVEKEPFNDICFNF